MADYAQHLEEQMLSLDIDEDQLADELYVRSDPDTAAGGAGVGAAAVGEGGTLPVLLGCAHEDEDDLLGQGLFLSASAGSASGKENEN